jgi:hypothetical protein
MSALLAAATAVEFGAADMISQRVAFVALLAQPGPIASSGLSRIHSMRLLKRCSAAICCSLSRYELSIAPISALNACMFSENT